MYKNLIEISALFIAFVFIDISPQEAHALDPNTTEPVAVMNAVDLRDDGDRSKSRLTIKIIDKDGRTRERQVASRRLKFKEGNKQVMIFESPADVRGTGLLSVDYDSGALEDQQWLYLPSLHKSTRISSGEKSGSFMGTDLSFSDMTKADPKQYSYKMLKTSVKVKVDGVAEDCWLIESRPNTKKTKEETGYIKSNVWVSKSKMMPVQIKSWIREGKKLKYIKFQSLKQIDGIWIAHKIVARTKKGKKVESATVLQFTDMSFNQPDVNEDLFTLSRLEQGL
jgi:outer membrane lipoprotein-sorting protein